MKTLEALLEEIQNVRVIDYSIGFDKYIPFDLSVSNNDLDTLNIQNATDFETYIENYLSKNKAKIAYGGYNEERNLYKKSIIFNNNETNERNIHIGIDLWTKAGTSILAAIDGKIHSFNFNTGKGNYGPTIILEHHIENQTFYTLYGHLSVESIENIEIGDTIKKGQVFTTLGDASVNGGYSPHLHFQIINDIQANFGDYPGVCSKKDLPFYLKNCPDPNTILKINKS
jgi:murein DD-endopeptidase MepM/ murein hydrolase activator NlpD